MERKKILRINELAKKAKTAEGLTENEKLERKALRDEYIADVRKSLRAQLENVDVDMGGGRVVPLSELKKR